MTPKEKYSCTIPDITNLCIFGCLSFLHIPKESRKKLDSKTHKCLFLGCDSESKVYRVFEPRTRKIILSRDVVFDENRIGYNYVLGDSTLPEDLFPSNIIALDDDAHADPETIPTSLESDQTPIYNQDITPETMSHHDVPETPMTLSSPTRSPR
jgi:hypothetical protein